MVVTINQLRDLADYNINLLRRGKKLSDIKVMAAYAENSAKPEFFFDRLFQSSAGAPSNLKTRFLDLAQRKAEMMFKITQHTDAKDTEINSKGGLGSLSLQLWGPIQNAFKDIKHFFGDLMEKTDSKVQQIKEQLESAIHEIRKRVGDCNIERGQIDSNLDIAEATTVLQPNNFQPSPFSKANKLAAIVQNINSIGKKHSDNGLNEPDNLVTNLVEIGKIEYDLDSCIKELAA